MSRVRLNEREKNTLKSTRDFVGFSLLVLPRRLLAGFELLLLASWSVVFILLGQAAHAPLITLC